MTTFYLSVEQEAALNDSGLVKGERLDYNYIVVSAVSWGAEGPDWKPTLIGPIHDSRAVTASSLSNNVATLLCSLGHKVVQAGKERGEWFCGFYKPHPDEITPPADNNLPKDAADALQGVLGDVEHGRRDFAPNAYVINSDVIACVRAALTNHGHTPYQRGSHADLRS